MGKMAVAPQKRILEQNFQLLTPPKVWVSGFLSVDGNAKLVSAITENGKNGRSSPKMHPRAKLPITDLPKVWVSGFLSVDGNEKLVSTITENGKNGHSSPKMRPRAKLPITDPLKFGSPHESVLEQGFSFYPTSHLCVVLHFLIFYSGQLLSDQYFDKT